MWLFNFICMSLGITQAQKYHQNDYNAKLDIVQIVNVNHSYFTDGKCDLVHYNRSYRAINASGRLVRDLSMNLKLNLQVYKFLSNEYRFFPITMEIDGCKELKRDSFGIMASLQKSMNFPLRCPIKKGFLAMTYGMVNFSSFPPYIPGGAYKTETKIYDDLNYVITTHVFYKVDEILKKWEN